MDFLKDRRALLILGAAVALLAGVLIGWALLAAGRDEQAGPPPAASGGLVIDSSSVDERLDPARPLRCFVAGQLVGEFTLAECARRNGVATGSLDVGLDETGALAATEAAGALLTPLPPVAEAIPAEPVEPSVDAPAAGAGFSGPVGACWRYGEGQWRRMPVELTLGACAQALFAGRCERPGGATYGRWAQQTLRLTPGRVEISADNRSFRTLVEQGPGCTLPPA